MLKQLSVLAAAIGFAVVAMAAPTHSVEPLKGEVLEAKDAGAYTYLRLKTKSGETWAAVQHVTVAKGAQVTIADPMQMKDFESRTLNRKFDRIVLGTLVGDGGRAVAATPAVDTADDVKVAKASGPEARTVAEVVGKRSEVKDKTVAVRGKVVKFTPGVMGRNWVHLRDGTGSASDRTNDLLVTTSEDAKIGDVITARGTVRVDQNFGSGYAYAVVVEQATLKR